MIKIIIKIYNNDILKSSFQKKKIIITIIKKFDAK